MFFTFKFLLLLMLLFFTSASAWAQPGKFIPTILNYRGDLDLEFNDETYEDKSDQSSFTRAETSFIERITLTAFGFVYHPRFIVFRASLTGEFKQVKFDYNTEGSFQKDNRLGYSFNMIVLPRHPYTLEIHSSRSAPVTEGSYGQSVYYSVDGISFKYKKQPYFAELGYDHSKTDSSVNVTVGDSVRVSASHITRMSNTNASLSLTSSDISTPGLKADNESDIYSFFNRTEYKRYRLYSKVELFSYQQKSSNDTLRTDRFSVNEWLEIDLPWNFKSEFRYFYNNNDYETEKSKTSATYNTASGKISHTLFKSLDTSYRVDYSKQEFDAGESQRVSQMAAISYSKKIPWGGVLAGFYLGSASVESSGTAVISFETQPSAPLPSDLLLKSANIDEILSVDVKDPGTGLFVRLSEGDYLVTQIGSLTIITFQAVPPTVADAAEYEFQVSYSIRQEDISTRERTVGYNLNINLFDGMVSAFYNHMSFNQDLLSGPQDRIPSERTSDTIGITLRRQPFMLRLEYADMKTDLDSTKKMAADLYFDKALSRTLTVFAHANYYDNKHEYLATEFSTVETGAGLGFRKEFTSTKINFSSSIRYSLRSGDVEGNSYYLNSTLSWNIRRTNLMLGATITHNESESPVTRTEHDSQVFYLKLKRQIF